MKRVQFIIIYILCASISMLSAGVPTFAGIPWLTPAAEVKLIMAEKGYVYIDLKSDDGNRRENDLSWVSDLDLDFSGKIMGVDCNVHFVFNESNMLVQASVNFEDKNHENKFTSSLGHTLDRDVHEHLDQKYGKPTRIEEIGGDKDVITVIKRHWTSFQDGYSIMSSVEVMRYILDGEVSGAGKLSKLSLIYGTPMGMDEYFRRKNNIKKAGKLNDL